MDRFYGQAKIVKLGFYINVFLPGLKRFRSSKFIRVEVIEGL